jgi:HTH-type transcriptional regulator / antitoxin HigA
MNTLKVLRSESAYKAALERFEKLLNARKGSPGYDERDVLAVLIERYEDEHHRIDPPDPREAIKFRMEQAGLSRKDLAPHLGGKSKVSEVLSGKRELTLSAVRALHKHLGIPADVLIGQRQESLSISPLDLDFRRFPVAEMQNQGAFREYSGKETKDRPEEAVRWLIEQGGGLDALAAGLRTTAGMRVKARLNRYALLGWSLQVLANARRTPDSVSFSPKALSKEFFHTLVGLSVLDDGPRNAQNLLAKVGIQLVAVPHLKHAYLDGAVFLADGGRPVVGLTLRYDRIDNFWFVLFHELGHLVCGHLTKKKAWIADDLDLPHSDSPPEVEADKFAGEALLPPDFDLHLNEQLSIADVLLYATERAISPAIVAGRIQYERKDYRSFSRLLGHGEVRKQFWKPFSEGDP